MVVAPRSILAIAALLAWLVLRREPRAKQRTLTFSLIVFAAAEAVRPGLRWLYHAPAWERFARATWALYVALGLLWYVITAGCVWLVLAKNNGPDPKIGAVAEDAIRESDYHRPNRSKTTLALLALPVALYLAYPSIRGLPIETATRSLFFSCLAVQVGTVVLWTRRDSDRGDDGAERCALMLAASSCFEALGPWIHRMPSARWYDARWINVATWACVAGWEAWCLINARRRRGTSS